MIRLNLFFYSILIIIIYCSIYTLNRPLSDPDSYYHASAARSLSTNTEFNPKLPFTIFSQFSGDQHYGYHLIQSFFSDSFLELKICQTILCCLCVLVFLFITKMTNPKYALWVCILLLTSYGFMNRVSVIKASPLSIFCYLVFISGLLFSNALLILTSSMLFVLSHSGFIICIFPLIAYLISGYKNPSYIKIIFSSLFGVACGIATHPESLNYLEIVKVQGIDFALLNNVSNSIQIGEEWQAPTVKKIIYSNLPILICYLPLLFAGLFSFTKLEWNKKFLLINSCIITAMYLHSERFIEYLIPSILLYSCIAIKDNFISRRLIVMPSLIFAVFFLPIAIKAQTKHKPVYFPEILLSRIKEKASNNETICNLDWTDYPFLQFKLPQFNYLFGLDPRFLAIENIELYKTLDNFLENPTQIGLEKIRRITNCKIFITSPNTKRAQLFFERNINQSIDGYQLVFFD